MSEHVALFHEGDVAIHQMKIRAADRASGHPDDGIAALLDLGIRNIVAADVALAVPTKCFHA
jgi:hypothetical protein